MQGGIDLTPDFFDRYGGNPAWEERKCCRNRGPEPASGVFWEKIDPKIPLGKIKGKSQKCNRARF